MPSTFLISFGENGNGTQHSTHELCINFHYFCTLCNKSQVHVRILKIYIYVEYEYEDVCASFDDSIYSRLIVMEKLI